MKNLLLSLAVWLLAAAAGAQTVNLTPRPASLTVTGGTIELPQGFTVSTATAPRGFAVEAQRFVDHLNRTTDLQPRLSNRTKDIAFVRCRLGADTMNAEGYRLSIGTRGIDIEARTEAGLYYAFQTLKKLLPPHVMAGVHKAGTDYRLPALRIDDRPRFAYRGFMLDVARHFQTVEEVKRMLDIMAVYKMNRFHWHLTDDQGWRVQIKRYPRLTEVGAVADSCWYVDLKRGAVQTHVPYGPYYYTQEQIRDVVAYAAERHIEVIPEIDMPGHFVAALVAYPEFSCTPQAARSVWTRGGVSRDVLNVASPAALRFAEGILSEICDLFPSRLIHIGGDECPTDAWRENAECRALVQREGLKSYRELQSRFTARMARFLAKRGRQTAVWNESLTADSTDRALIARTGATVFCWHPCQQGARMAAEHGLPAIVTQYGAYYINRKQSKRPEEPQAAGNGSDDLKATYDYVPVPAAVPAGLTNKYVGVQGTFWTEFVATPDYLEYLALPRLIAVAEAGWTPQGLKDFPDFLQRLKQDTALLDLGHYTYGRHFIDGPEAGE